MRLKAILLPKPFYDLRIRASVCAASANATEHTNMHHALTAERTDLKPHTEHRGETDREEN